MDNFIGKRFVIKGLKEKFTKDMNNVIDNLVSVENLTISNTDLKSIDVLPRSEEIHIVRNSELETLEEISDNTKFFIMKIIVNLLL